MPTAAARLRMIRRMALGCAALDDATPQRAYAVMNQGWRILEAWRGPGFKVLPVTTLRCYHT